MPTAGMVVPVIENFVEEFQTAEWQICCDAAGGAERQAAGEKRCG
jgi:hypothetical protein